MNEVFKFKDMMYEWDKYIDIVMESLQQYKFATAETLALAKKANKNEIKNAIKDGVIKYVRENPNIEIKEVCKTLKVKSIYIAELVDEGRIVANGDDIESLAIEMRREEKEAEQMNKRLSFQEQNNALIEPPKKEEIKKQSNAVAFHTRFNRR